MNRIGEIFKRLKKNRRKGLIAYLTMGYPSLAATEEMAVALWKSGVDILELGIPFSDPIADGPTIQWSSERALEHHVHSDQLWALVQKIRKKTDLGLVAMTYYNVVCRMGLRAFLAKARRAGLDGLIVPDLSLEESGPLRQAAEKTRIALIQLAAPTSSSSRFRSLALSTQGFLYVVSVTGVTGARKTFPKDTLTFLKKTRVLSKKPVALGFGISTPQQAKRLAPYVDAIIVGSAFIEKIRNANGRNSSVHAVSRLAKSLRRALDASER